MASLEDLLAAEGFKKPKRRPHRSSLPPRSDSMPVPSCPRREKNRTLRSEDRRRSFPDDLPRSSLRCEDSRKSRAAVANSKEVSIASSSDDRTSPEIVEVFDGLDGYKPIERRGYKNAQRSLLHQRRSVHANSKEVSIVSFSDESASCEIEEVFEQYDSSPIEAVVSVLTGYITRFLDDEMFRMSTYHRCVSCLLPAETRRGKDTGPIGTLKRAIGTVERAVNGHAGAQELKKASLQLSVITSFSSAEMKSGYTSGVPNINLAACAHLYLAVIYKLNGKDAVSAKHLLDVFADCPSRARTVLLPELWDRIFLVHVPHLEWYFKHLEWYFKQEESIGQTADRAKKLALLEEVYNANLDTGTKCFALYYKKWLVDGGDAPELPSVSVPDRSFSESSGEISRPHGSPDRSLMLSTSSSYKATVSRELYESVFAGSIKVEKYREIEIENIGKHVLRSPDRLSSSSSDDDVEWANVRRNYSHNYSHEQKDHMENKSESKHGSRLSLPSFSSRARASPRPRQKV